MVDKTGERLYEAELYRLKGELTLQTSVQVSESRVHQSSKIRSPAPNPRPPSGSRSVFSQGHRDCRKPQAKSLELRAVMSLVRLRQQQATQNTSRTRNTHRLDEAHQLLSEIYDWFTEGFDTKDLQEAKALLEELSH